MQFKDLVVLLTMVVGVCGSQRATKLYKPAGASITSSTLIWMSITKPESIPANAVPVVEGGHYWCLVKENAVHIPGVVIGSKCKAAFFSVIESTEFEVLVNVGGSANLVREKWDFQEAIPNKAVLSSEMLLAYAEEDGGILVGRVYPQDSPKRAFFLKDNKVVNRTKGVILTEVEPISYKLHNINLDILKTEFKEEIYEIFPFSNHGSNSQKLQRKVPYVDHVMTVYATDDGCSIGLPTTVVSPGETYHMNWGIPRKSKPQKQHKLEYQLPSQSYVNVTVYGIVREDYDAYYSASLTSIYNTPHLPLTRNISGRYVNHRFLELRANFSRIFSLNHHNVILGSQPQSEILIHSTTTTTTTPTPPWAEKVGDGDGSMMSATFGLIFSIFILQYFL